MHNDDDIPAMCPDCGGHVDYFERNVGWCLYHGYRPNHDLSCAVAWYCNGRSCRQ